MLSPRTGLGVLETAVLAAVAELGGRPEAGYRKSTRVLQLLEREHGFGPRYAYPLLADLVAPWRLHLPLLEGNGNWGSQGSDPPADARYTQLRLSAVGALALAAERGEIGPVPLGLVEGSLYRGGPVPPFDPQRVVAALQESGTDAGPPALPTGGTVEGDLQALSGGRKARLQLGSIVEREDGQLVITRVPLGVSVDRVSETLQRRRDADRWSRRRPVEEFPATGEPGAAGPEVVRFGFIAERADAQPSDGWEDDGDPARPSTGVVDVCDVSNMRTGIRIVCRLADGADVDAAEWWVRSVWPVTVEADCQLPAPMDQRLRTWEAGDGSGLAGLAALL